jgi:hypothetical protein
LIDKNPIAKPELRAVVARADVGIDRAREKEHEADGSRDREGAIDEARRESQCTKGFECSDGKGQP